MPKKIVQYLVDVDATELAVLCSPRDDFMVKEKLWQPASPGLSQDADQERGHDGHRRQNSEQTLRFALIEGAFTHYQRTLAISPQGVQTYRVTETTSFRLSVPFWAPALNFLVRHELRQPRTADSPRLPWWLPAERLNARSGHVLGVLCLMSFFTGYLGTLLGQTLTFVSDTFGADKGTQGIVLSIVRVGALLSLAVALLADRHGRKFLLRIALPGAFVLTALGALSFGIWSFAGAQTLARGLTTAVAVLIGIVAAEEMPAGARAYAASVLSMSAALGAGVMVILLPLADTNEQAWRILFVIPLLALPALVWLLQKLPETWRFELTQKSLGAEAGSASLAPSERNLPAPEHSPAPPEKQRLLLLGSALFLFLLFVTPASQFLNEFLRDERGFSGAKITAFQLLSNTPAGISLYLAGRWSDIRGRRHIAMLALVGMTAFTVMRYASAGWTMWGWSLGSSIFAAAVVPTLGVYGPELFSTARRASSNGTLTVIGVCGSALGVLAVGHFTEHWVSFGTTFAILSFAPLLVVLLLLFAFPETARQELEALNPSDKPSPELADPADANIGDNDNTATPRPSTATSNSDTTTSPPDTTTSNPDTATSENL